MTTRRQFIGMGLAVAGAGLAGCATFEANNWVTLVDGIRVPVDWRQLGKGKGLEAAIKRQLGLK